MSLRDRVDAAVGLLHGLGGLAEVEELPETLLRPEQPAPLRFLTERGGV